MHLFTCKVVLGKVRRERKARMSEDTWKLVKERHALKAKLEAAKTRKQGLAATKIYNKTIREVKKSCRRDKKSRIDVIAQEAKVTSEQNNMKKVCDTTRLLSGRRTTQSKRVKDTNGVVLSRIDNQLNQWKEYFQEVFFIYLFIQACTRKSAHSY